MKLFHYIDAIFSKTKNHADYQAWIEEAGKYIKTSKDKVGGSESNAISKATHQFPFKLIAGTRWKSIIIQFLNPNRVSISVGKYQHETNYADMGFSDGRNSKPNQQWVFLRTLARIGGEMTWKDSEAQKKYKKTKELLSESLRTYFPIDDDPFFPYHSGEDGKVE